MIGFIKKKHVKTIYSNKLKLYQACAISAPFKGKMLRKPLANMPLDRSSAKQDTFLHKT